MIQATYRLKTQAAHKQHEHTTSIQAAYKQLMKHNKQLMKHNKQHKLTRSSIEISRARDASHEQLRTGIKYVVPGTFKSVVTKNN